MVALHRPATEQGIATQIDLDHGPRFDQRAAEVRVLGSRILGLFAAERQQEDHEHVPVKEDRENPAEVPRSPGSGHDASNGSFPGRFIADILSGW
jgi:hypothetical protein